MLSIIQPDNIEVIEEGREDGDINDDRIRPTKIIL